MMSRNPSEGENCAACLNPQPNSYFCKEHAFHEKCIVEVIYRKSDQFIQTLQIHAEMENGRINRLSFSVPDEQLPKCSNCGEEPLRQTYSINTI